MKTLAIHLRLETASHRKRLMGIFRRIGAAAPFDVRIIASEDGLCDLLTSPNAADRPDGIISGIPHSERTKRAIGQSGIPFVGIGMTERELAARAKNTGFVLNDNAGIGKAAAEFFLRLGGFRSFAYVPDTHDRRWSVLRGQAFMAELKKAGKRCTVCRADAADTSALPDFLVRLPRPAAVFAAWDGRAADVLHAAHKANLRIPGDVSVLGVDDDELICEHTTPPLSSIRTNAEGMGDESARMLMTLMAADGKAPARKPRTVRCPILGITERGTTGAPAPAATMVERALAFIDTEATNGIRPDDVAKYLKVSRRLLDLRFRQTEDKSVSETITEKKMASVRRLLADSDTPIKEVFRRSGFNDISYATKLFKRTNGMTPNAWRSSRRPASKRRAFK